MQPIAYLFFKDQCRAAMMYYGGIFGTTPEIMTFADMPDADRAGMPGAPDDAVMHAALAIDEGWIYGADDPFDEMGPMKGCSITLSLPGEAETWRVWAALAEGGEVGMALSPMFFAPLFGMLTDRFGIRWMIMTDAGPA
ncbi:VOC family protein [Aliiroseovarius sp.]|uniref:VOC family protein n=1 Tax=Aliiroseovarius sp. TaxID=1872442 RepID=UPI0026111D4B|nr:VOC family protein [Aliiroseovarius sp.]